MSRRLSLAMITILALGCADARGADTTLPIPGAVPQTTDAPAPPVAKLAAVADLEVAFKQAQERYGAVLGGQSPLIRQAEVNGKSIYRVRVGPMAKESADGLCGRLKAAGAACFVAKN